MPHRVVCSCKNNYNLKIKRLGYINLLKIEVIHIRVPKLTMPKVTPPNLINLYHTCILAEAVHFQESSIYWQIPVEMQLP